MLAQLAHWCLRRRRIVLASWLGLLVGLTALHVATHGTYKADFRLPGADSQAAYDLLKDRFPVKAGDSFQVVVQSDRWIDDPAWTAKTTSLITSTSKLPGMESVTSPYSTDGASQVSPNRHVAYADVALPAGTDLPQTTIDRVDSLVAAARAPGMQLELSG